jgi:hypothetical protein
VSKQAEKEERCSFDLLSGRKEERVKERKRAKNLDRVWQKAWSIGKNGEKMGKRTLSTGESQSRRDFVHRTQLAQATRKPRVWANTGESP